MCSHSVRERIACGRPPPSLRRVFTLCKTAKKCDGLPHDIALFRCHNNT